MSNDPLLDHLENMTNMNSSRHWEQPYCYATTPEQEAEIAAQKVLDDAAQRVATNSFKGSKLLIERALGVKLG